MTLVVSKFRQAMFHVNFFTSHVSKMCGSSMIPSSWSVQPSGPRLSTDGHMGDAPTPIFLETLETGLQNVSVIGRAASMLTFSASSLSSTFYSSRSL